MQSTSGDRTDNRTFENGLPYATELPLGRTRRTNQRSLGCNRMEFEEIDGKIERFYPDKMEEKNNDYRT
jgi:hypothetical protein